MVFCGVQFCKGSIFGPVLSVFCVNWFLRFCEWYFGDGDITLFLHLILQQLADSAALPAAELF